MNAIDIFPWDDNFSTGLPQVDEQHRKLVHLLNQLASSVAFGSDSTRLNEIFDELLDYTVYHFQTEEAIWHQYMPDDPSEIAHRATHATFVATVLRLKAEQAQKPLARIAEDALEFLVRWLASHILETDRQMAHIVLALQEGLNLDQAKLSAAERMSGSTRAMIDIILSIYATLSRNTLRLMRELVERKQTEDALRLSEERLSFALRGANDGLWDWNLDTNDAYYSPRWLEMLGYQADELPHTMATWALLVHPEDKERTLAAATDYVAGRTPRFEVEFRMRHKHGHWLHILARGHLARDAAGELLTPRRIVGTHVDITERKQSEEALRLGRENLQLILDNAPIGIWLQDGTGHMSFVNKAFCNAVGVNEAQFLAVPHYAELIDPNFRPQCLASDAKALASTSISETQQQLPFVDGKVHDLRVMKAVKRDASGKPVALIGISVDITDELKQQHALEEAKRAAEAANLAKSQFLATMSHEIRTPLNGVLGMAQLLLMPDLDRSEQQEFARTIINSGHTLLALLNDVLDLAKVEAGKLELVFASFDPSQLLDEVAALMVESAARKGLALAAHWQSAPAKNYRGDPIRIRQMLGNLVSNAIKFTDQGQILVTASETRRENREDVAYARVRFTVSDTGIGIPADKLDRLFQPFSQVDASETRRFGGTGLGLSIIRSLAERMGGEVGVDSSDGKGSRFWFELPLEIVSDTTDQRSIPRPAELSAVANAEGTSAGRILLVDDSTVNRMVVERLLAKFHFSVVSAEDGAQALDHFQREGHSIDLILMDLQMPVMDGLEAARKIRAHEANEGNASGGHIPIIALTANAFDKDRRACVDAGMDDFLAKPVNTNQLLLTIETWLPRRLR
jgi:hemerythrin-like metal-binding protein/PAS domain S-box-containing protein